MKKISGAKRNFRKLWARGAKNEKKPNLSDLNEIFYQECSKPKKFSKISKRHYTSLDQDEKQQFYAILKMCFKFNVYIAYLNVRKLESFCAFGFAWDSNFGGNFNSHKTSISTNIRTKFQNFCTNYNRSTNENEVYHHISV